MLPHLEEFSDVINSIQFLHMSKNDMNVTTNSNESSQQVQQQPVNQMNYNSDINNDNIFFYEDPQSVGSDSQSSDMEVNNNHMENDKNLLNNGVDKQDHSDYEKTITNGSQFGEYLLTSLRNEELRNIQVNVGIDEDLKMILEMDPSLVDDLDTGLDACANIVDDPKITGLPPITGG